MSAFVFGLLAVAAAYAVSCMSRTNQTIALILAGMMVSSLFSAGTSYLKLVADTQQQLPAITYWLMGSLSSIKPRDVLFLVIPVTLGLVPLLILSWRMNLLTLGEEEARSMGVNTRLLRFTVILCATLLTAASVAVSGMIGWVGLVIPHFCRMLFGYDYRAADPGCGPVRGLVPDHRGRHCAARHGRGDPARHPDGLRRCADLPLSDPDGRCAAWKLRSRT